jgi:hypothetical protein
MIDDRDRDEWRDSVIRLLLPSKLLSGAAARILGSLCAGQLAGLAVGLVGMTGSPAMAQPATAAPAPTVSSLSTEPAAGGFRVEQTESGVTVFDGEQLVTQYVFQSRQRPILWPLIGPDAVRMTRDYPMQEGTAGERSDHPHHRSLWFTHGEVDDQDFWAEGDRRARVEHREVVRSEADAKRAVIETRSDWVSVDGRRLLSEHRTMTFHGTADRRLIDLEITLVPVEGPVHFGDTKEGTLGIRVAGSMKVDAGLGGRIINNRGQSDGDAWGQPAEWVDYHGPIGEQRYGIAILCHPSSTIFPGRWHVRTYGLFAHNPFGESDFTGGTKTSGYLLEPDQKLHFRYRVVLHRGDAQEGRIAQEWESFEVTP